MLLPAIAQACAPSVQCPEPTTPAPTVESAPPPLRAAVVEAEGLRVSVQGLRVVAAPHFAGDEELQVGGVLWSQTIVDLLVVDREGRLLGIAHEQTRLDAIGDETGEAVRLRGSPFRERAHPPSGFDETPEISGDRTAMILPVSAEGTPTPGARELRVRGTIGVAVGGARAVATAALELREGESVTLGDVELRVRRVGPAREPGTLRVDCEIPAGVAAFESLEDLTATSDGDPVELRADGLSVLSGDFGRRVSISLLLGRTDVTRLELHATYVTDRRVITIPLDLAVGVGL